MTMKTGALLILAGLGCFVAFNLLGSTLDAQGFLHEPFALLPLGYLLLFTGMVLTRSSAAQGAHQGAMTQIARCQELSNSG